MRPYRTKALRYSNSRILIAKSYRTVAIVLSGGIEETAARNLIEPIFEREICQSGSEGGASSIPGRYPYQQIEIWLRRHRSDHRWTLMPTQTSRRL
jgi:hypothetical protein